MKLRTAALALALTLTFMGCSSSKTTANIHQPDQAVTDATVSLQLLKDGNERYVSNQGTKKDHYSKERDLLKEGQKPFAVILTCSDSRVAPEIYFDQQLGDIFVVRNAGDIAEASALGSIEYAVEHLHAPLVVVVGHSKCGAVTAAVNGGEFPSNLESILTEIKKGIHEGSDVDVAIHDNINSTIQTIQNDEVIHSLGTTVVGAYYDIETGKIMWQ